MTPDQIEAERVRFEAWWREGIPESMMARNEQGYCAVIVNYAWVGWLARAEEQYASEAAAVELMEHHEPQRLAMAAKHERGE